MVRSKTILVTQARTGSTRLPGKILKKIKGKSLLQIHLERLKKCKNISEIIVATTNNSEDKIIYDKSIQLGCFSARGSENDVLDRFYQAVKDKNPDWIVRVTSDCPLIDPVLVDKIISFVQVNNMDYGSNTLIENFPDGQDVEVFKFSALQIAWKNAKLLSEREHVTPYIRNNCDVKGKGMFKTINYSCGSDYSKIRMTVDEVEDFKLLKVLITNLGIHKSWKDYTKYIIDNNLNKLNNNIIRNEGYLNSSKKD